MAASGLKIIFAGTPDFAAIHLRVLLDSPHHISAVYTQPDRPAGRGKKLQPSPVKQLAESAGLIVEQPVSLKNPEAQTTLKNFAADVMVVVAYGLLLPPAVLETPRFGCINVHASLLPRWRGAAPIQRSIEAGDAETGITIMQMDAGLDTGAMLLVERCPIEAADTAESLHDRLARLGPPALLEALSRIADGSMIREVQNQALATYAPKLSKEEAAIDWNQSAALIDRRIRAFNPYPVAYTFSQGESLRVYQAQPEIRHHDKKPGAILAADTDLLVACGDNTALRLQVVQLPGKRPMSVRDLLNGASARFGVGTLLGAP